MKFQKRKSMILVGCVLGFWVVAWMMWEVWTLPDVSALKSQYPRVTHQAGDAGFSVTLESRRPRGWIPLSGISKPAQIAIMISEDWAFFSHPGYDVNQIKETISDALEEGELSRGASTITQQVIKNVYLSHERSIIRKLKELRLAMELEKTVSKNRILEIYLNIVELGRGIYGVPQAAQYYFQKTPDALTAKEGAFLAMLLPSPKRYSVSFRKRKLTPYARKTVKRILRKMHQAHYLTLDELEWESQQPFEFEGSSIDVPNI